MQQPVTRFLSGVVALLYVYFNTGEGKQIVNTLVFLGKTTAGGGAFALFVVYLLIPKPHLAPQFATLSLLRPYPGTIGA